jgi:acetylornithine aminotransferase
MANENALKIAFQKNAPANRILAFERGFAGRTLVMSQVTEKNAVRDGLPITSFVDYIPFFDPNEPEKSTKDSVEALKKVLARYPKSHGAMLFEMVQGEGGFYPGSHEFFRAIMEILKENNIAVLVDEIQTFGRTPNLFAYKYFELDDLVDIVTIGKISVTCATLWKKEYDPRPGLLSQTFTSSSSAIFAAKRTIEMMVEEKFFGINGKNNLFHRQFSHNLSEIGKRNPQLVRGPWGLGSMVAFTPLDGDMNRVSKFGQNLFKEGVMSFIAGKNPTRIRFLLPAGVITPHDIDAVSTIIEKALLCS